MTINRTKINEVKSKCGATSNKLLFAENDNKTHKDDKIYDMKFKNTQTVHKTSRSTIEYNLMYVIRFLDACIEYNLYSEELDSYLDELLNDEEHFFYNVCVQTCQML